MSSAILYVAIVAIWACVLIPRWLKRDTSQAKAPKAPREVPGDAAADTDGAEVAMDEDDVAADGLPEAAGAAEYEHDSRDEHGPDRSQSRTRILRARRRMLLVLLALTVVAVGIVVVGMAAWWVAGPPIVMLGGYLLLLREARRADAERARRLAGAAGYRREAEYRDEVAYRDEAEYRDEADYRDEAGAPAETAAPAEEEPRAVPEAPEPLEEPLTARIIDISERVVQDELYDQYADAERRAVGD